MNDYFAVDGETGRLRARLNLPIMSDLAANLLPGEIVMPAEPGVEYATHRLNLQTMKFELVDQVVVPVDEGISITSFEYLQLFTFTERAAARASSDPHMQDAIMFTNASPTINLSNEQVLQGIDLMTALGILTPERAAAVKAGEKPE